MRRRLRHTLPALLAQVAELQTQNPSRLDPTRAK
jgi:hypothetical protein